VTTAWTLTRERLCDKAMEKCGALGVGETPSAADRSLCLEALDGLLKTLAWDGYAWPKYSQTSTSITYTAATPTVTMPTDFYDSEMLFYTDSGGNDKQLARLTTDQWADIPNKAATGTYPVKYWMNEAHVAYIWPIPTASVAGKLWYQKIIDDSVAGSPVDLDSPWNLGLVYGVAIEIADEFDVPEQKIARFMVKWADFKRKAIQNTAYVKPYCVSVDQ